MAAAATSRQSAPERTAKRRGVVFVTYNGLLDPLGPSQMLPYLERLNDTWPVTMISFERREKLEDEAAVVAMEKHLDDRGMGWVRLRYHKWPSLPATTFDLLHGAYRLRRLLATKDIGLVHARGYVPAAIALRATRKVPLLFDIRGLQAEEYVDGGVWREGELKWRLAKRSERKFFRAAAGAVVLTKNIRPHVESQFRALGNPIPLEVIPCCADLDKYRFDATGRARHRAELGVDDETTLFVYAGSVGTWYLTDEMARFVRLFRDGTNRKVRLLWLVNNDRERALAAGDRAGLSRDEQRVATAKHHEMPAYLSAADVSLALIKPSFSKRSSSPTKYAECLAVGLPLVLSRGVGDSGEIADSGGAVALDEFDDDALRASIEPLLALLTKPREHFRAIAAKLFDVNSVALPSYRRLYERLVVP